MFKILVVDDEPKIRRGIACIIEEEKGKWGEILEASNGKTALDIVKRHHPAIVITDIKMPIKDGMEFIEELREIDSNIQIVIISGFRDFDNARKAFRFKVFEYLLKPIDRNELLSVLEKAKKELQLNAFIKNNAIKNIDVKEFFDMLLNKLQLNRAEDDIFEAFPEEVERKIGDYFIVYFEFCSDPIEFIFPTDQNSRRISSIETWIDESMNELYQSYHLVKMASGKYIVIVYSCTGSDLQREHEISKRARQLIKMIPECRFFIGVSRGKSKMTDFLEAYNEAFTAAKRYIYHCENGVYFYSRPHSDDSAKFDKLAETLVDQISEVDEEGYNNSLKTIFNEIDRQQPDIDLFRRMKNIIKTGINAKLESMDNLDNDGEIEWAILDEIENCCDVRTIKENLEDFVYFTAGIFSKFNDKVLNLKVRAVKQYIDKNYQDIYSLSYLAEKISINPSYLSHIFKKSLGMGFIDYLTNVRIENAKRLLVTTDMDIFKIAESVGIVNICYFTQVFKKYTGLSASKYRTLSRKI